MRLLFFAALIYLGYRVFKWWLLPGTDANPRVHQEVAGQIDDVMIKDPYCQVYFPKREGIELVIDGKPLYFCSKECRDKYLEQRSGTQGHA